VLGEAPDIERSRLALCRAAGTVIAVALDLVGVEAPERM
jgi:arginyl-tRNA synthetase